MSGRVVLRGLIILGLATAVALAGCKVVIRTDNPREAAATPAATESAVEIEPSPQPTATSRPSRVSTLVWRMQVLPSQTPTFTPTPTATPTPSATPTVTATPTPVVYVVKKGDTLSLIAKRYGVTVVALMAANDLGHPDAIRAGERLTIPRGPGIPGPTGALRAEATATLSSSPPPGTDA